MNEAYIPSQYMYVNRFMFPTDTNGNEKCWVSHAAVNIHWCRRRKFSFYMWNSALNRAVKKGQFDLQK